jgi:hypothetical protein
VDTKENGAFFHASQPPDIATEYPADMWLERSPGTIVDALAGLEVVSNEAVVRSGIDMRRVVFREDFYTPPEVVLYVWNRGGQTIELGGPNVMVVERAISSLRENSSRGGQ